MRRLVSMEKKKKRILGRRAFKKGILLVADGCNIVDWRRGGT
jgi:hypothetical protein